MFHVIYNVRNPKNRIAEDRRHIKTLSDAVDSYCPDADLVMQVGTARFPLDICRDMYGLYEDLFIVMHAVAFDLHCDNVGYPDVLIPLTPEQKSYGIMLGEHESPHILVFIADRQYVYFQSRTLSTEGLVAGADDVTNPVVVPKREVIDESASFLLRYLDDLTSQLPFVGEFGDYKEYVREVIEMQAG